MQGVQWAYRQSIMPRTRSICEAKVSNEGLDGGRKCQQCMQHAEMLAFPGSTTGTSGNVKVMR